MIRVLVITLAAIVVGGCSQEAVAPEPSPFQLTIKMHDLMAAVLDPATDVIWGAAGEVITIEGARDLAPTTDEGWAAVRNAAAVVAESGNLLLLPGRAHDDEAWREYSQALTRLGVLTMAAADAKDDAAIFDLGGQLYNVCVACHQSYAPDA